MLYRLGKQVPSTWLSETMAGASFVNPVAKDYRAGSAKVLSFEDEHITLFGATVAVLALQVWTYDHHFDVMRVPIWR